MRAFAILGYLAAVLAGGMTPMPPLPYSVGPLVREIWAVPIQSQSH